MTPGAALAQTPGPGAPQPPPVAEERAEQAQGTRFQVGGTLRAGSIYVPRAADQELPEALMRGELCYVLAPRQIGKSSLRVRARQTLVARGAACAAVDLTQIGSREATPAEWYYDLTESLGRQLGVSDVRAFWSAEQGHSPLHRFVCFLRERVLRRNTGRVVIFIDEIDAVLALPQVCRDDFFAAVRALYNARAEEDEVERLTFCLVGVALPSDLIADETRTPFNVGRAIPLQDFTRAEMAVMEGGLREASDDPAALLDAVYAWTAGHPYMTQKLCEALCDEDRPARGRGARDPGQAPAARVERLVEELFLRDGSAGGEGRVLETNLANAEKHFVRESKSPHCAPMLTLYGRLRSGEHVAVSRQDPVQMALSLTGMAAERRGPQGLELAVRNRIFAQVFDAAWVAARRAERYLAAPLQRWQESGRSDEHLLRGAALLDAYQWFRAREAIAPEENAFLMEGIMAKQRATEADALLLARRQRTLQIVTGALVLLFALASVVTLRDLRGAERLVRQMKQSVSAAREDLGRALKEGQDARAQTEVERERSRSAVAAAEQERQRALLEAQRANEQTQRARQQTLQANEEKLRSAAALQELDLKLTRAQDAIRRAETEKVLALAAAQKARQEESEQEQRARAAALRAQRAGELLSKLGDGSMVPAAAHWPAGDLVFGGPAYAAGFSPDGRWIVGASADGTALLWEVQSGRVVPLRGHRGPVNFAAFSPNGLLVITTGNDGTALVWETRSGELRSRIVGHPGPILMAHFSKDGQRLLTFSSDMSARLWEVMSGRQVLQLRGHRGAIYAAALSPDGARVAAVGWEGTVRQWSTRDGALMSVFGGNGQELGLYPLRAVVYSRDGTRLATAGDEGVGQIYDADSGLLLLRLRGHQSSVREIRYSPNGQLLVTASEDGSARLWDAGTGRQRTVLLGHKDAVNAVAFSEDGARVVTASRDGTARVWDALKGKAMLDLRAHGGPVLSARFSYDGARVVTASQDHRVRVFPGSLKAWAESGCNLAVDLPAGMVPPGARGESLDPHELKNLLCQAAGR